MFQTKYTRSTSLALVRKPLVTARCLHLFTDHDYTPRKYYVLTHAGKLVFSS